MRRRRYWRWFWIALPAAVAVVAALLWAGSDRPDREVILIGLDGVPWSVLQPLMESGRAPTLATLAFTGIRGYLETSGAGSPSKWTTMATGRPPEEHGINGFLTYDGTRMVTVKSYDRRVKAIWQYVSEQDLTVGVVNYLVTWPPEQVNGYMVGDKEPDRPYPPDLDVSYDPIRPPGFSFPAECTGPWREKAEDYYEKLVEDLSRAAALRRRYPVDLFIAYTHTTDAVEHRFWKFRQPERFPPPRWVVTPEEVDCYGEVIDRFLSATDALVERIVSGRSPESTVIVVSDHGMEAIRRETDNPMLLFDELYRALGFQPEEGGLPRLISVDQNKYDRWEWALLTFPDPAWKERKGEILAELARRLRALTVEPGGRPLFREVLLHEDAGKLPKEPPRWDIHIVDDLYNKQHAAELTIVAGKRRLPLGDFIRVPDISGTHRPQGIFIATGPGIRNTFEMPYLRGLDLAPTLMYLLDLPIPAEMRGRVMTEIFEPEWLAAHPVRRAEAPTAAAATPGPTTTPAPREELDEDAEEAALEELRALGYVQ
jgi:predicted AlkP superfamily phosphohydrolase/phosphomutase